MYVSWLSDSSEEEEQMVVNVHDDLFDVIESIMDHTDVYIDRYATTKYSKKSIETMEKSLELFVESRKKELKEEVLLKCGIDEMKPWAEPLYDSKIKKDQKLNVAEDLIILCIHCLETKVDLLVCGP